MPDLSELVVNPELALELERAEAASLLARMEGLAAVLRARLAGSDEPGRNGHPEPGENRLLTAEQVALALGLDVESVGRRKFPFRVKVSGRCVRYSQTGLEAYLRGLGGGAR